MSMTPTRGFTIIETLVAISILAVAIVGPLTAANVTGKSFRAAQDTLTASLLAQEGMEAIHARRDDNLLTASPWLTGLSSCVGASCKVNAITKTFTACAGSCPAVYVNSFGHYNQESDGTRTIFNRSLSITQNGNVALSITTVTWTNFQGNHSISLREMLQNWP